MITDPRGKLVYVNPAWIKAYGYSKEEAVGKTPRLLHSGYQAPQFYKEMWSQILDPNVGHWRGELVNRTKDGRYVPVLLLVTPFRNGNSKNAGFMGIAIDLSIQKQLETKVAQQQRLASIGQFASALAHEIGNPLGIIRGRAEFIKMLAPDNTQLTSGLEIIVSQIDRISRLIQDLLTLSRKQSDFPLVGVDLQSVLKETHRLMEDRLRENEIEFNIDLPSSMRVLGAPNLLQQVFLNLLINSVHAIEEEGRNGNKSNPSIRVTAALAGSEVVIQVTDTGCGIPPENMEKLFQPFFSTKEIGKGTGLGLAIISKLVHEMQGNISAASQPHQGATFTIHLKRA